MLLERCSQALALPDALGARWNFRWFRGCFHCDDDLRQTAEGRCGPFFSPTYSLTLLLATGSCILVPASKQFKSCASNSIGMLWAALPAFPVSGNVVQGPLGWIFPERAEMKPNGLGGKKKKRAQVAQDHGSAHKLSKKWDGSAGGLQSPLKVGSWGEEWGCTGCQDGSVSWQLRAPSRSQKK